MFIQALIGFGVLILFSIIGSLALIRFLNFIPKPVMKARYHNPPKTDETPILKPGDTIKVLNWNIQYAASRNHHFFYDGGSEVYASPDNVKATLEGISRVIREYQPDIILFQEIDLDSTRSCYTDQIQELLDANPYPSWSTTPYHICKYLPFPSHQHSKKLDMELTVFSRFPIDSATRHALPALKESYIRRAFNFKRAILDLSIPVQGGSKLRIFNTHFSAFSHGDGTLKKQVSTFVSLAQKSMEKGEYWLGAGDLNLLPPGDNPERLGKDGFYYPKTNNPIEPMLEALQTALPLEEYLQTPEKYYTYIPYGAENTDRWLDYIFISPNLQVKSYQVIPETQLSDHLPILTELTLL